MLSTDCHLDHFDLSVSGDHERLLAREAISELQRRRSIVERKAQRANGVQRGPLNFRDSQVSQQCLLLVAFKVRILERLKDGPLGGLRNDSVGVIGSEREVGGWMSNLLNSLLEVEALSRVNQYSLLSLEHFIDFCQYFELGLVGGELNTLLVPDDGLAELLVELILLLLEVLDEVETRWDALAVLLTVLVLVNRELGQDGFLDRLLISRHLRQLLLVMSILHLVAPESQDEVVTQLLDSSEDVDLRVVLGLLAVHLELLCHSTEQLDVVSVIQGTAHIFNRVQISLLHRFDELVRISQGLDVPVHLRERGTYMRENVGEFLPKRVTLLLVSGDSLRTKSVVIGSGDFIN